MSLENPLLVVIDVQEKLFPKVENFEQVLKNIYTTIEAFNLLSYPIVKTEQYSKGLGETVNYLKKPLGNAQTFEKTSFSALGTKELKDSFLSFSADTFVLVGIEAHVCVLQTAKDLVRAGKKVVVLNDAISSRSLFDYSAAIYDMRDFGVRVITKEICLFECLQDAKHPRFKEIASLIK